MKLKLFSNQNFLVEGMDHIIMLYPFWDKTLEEPADPQSGSFDLYINKGHSLFQMTSLKDADLAVLPTDWSHIKDNEVARELANQFIEEAKEAGKKVVIFFWNDSNEDIPVENSIVFRTSFSGNSSRKFGEFAMPCWYEDPIKKYLDGQLPIRHKSAKPVIGFCGQAALPRALVKQRVKDILRLSASRLGLGNRSKLKPKSGNVIRTQALFTLSRSQLVETNFIIRDQFYGGAVSLSGEVKWDLDLKQKVRREYIYNMLESDYILCVRGNGNYSHRFYETLCCGRIPVFVNTDCVLPYDFAIEWKKYCVWIDECELPLIGKKVAEFHEKISSQEFIELQYECRQLWKKWLSPEGFFTNFYQHF